MISKQKRKRIFYVPGMISLVLIPIVFLIYFYKTDAFINEGSIDFQFPSDSLMIEKFLSIKRKYKVYSFNNSEIIESENLNNLHSAIRKLNRENDTINGIQIHLGSKMKYEVYVKILDLVLVEKMPFFLQHHNDFFILMMPKPKPNKSLKSINFIICGYGDANKDIWLEEAKEAERKYVLSLYKKNWILFMGYLGLVLLNIFVLVKFNKTR
ncbi:hypothetical protein [Flavobacterium reichenbachii]|uniref:Uncharacterized protein n=1 Tax=Flavobacterium reichenbachii TaxID=362418 RepID=A0A085ZKR4_9FLAO|nr:hypothetical protein [Flavobacterium reichenbachii]KFF05028.1 hypothetical protein IW19_05575 [Flavobacterium reichenbachii]OXB16299.1 hypothetical protein B0A68_08575 [Flavobacterium reichenbachii]